MLTPDAPPPPATGAADELLATGSSVKAEYTRADAVISATYRFEALAGIDRASAAEVAFVADLVDQAGAFWADTYGPDDIEWPLVEGLVVDVLEASAPPPPVVVTTETDRERALAWTNWMVLDVA
jgi:hypothetical protein